MYFKEENAYPSHLRYRRPAMCSDEYDITRMTTHHKHAFKAALVRRMRVRARQAEISVGGSGDWVQTWMPLGNLLACHSTQ